MLQKKRQVGRRIKPLDAARSERIQNQVPRGPASGGDRAALQGTEGRCPKCKPVAHLPWGYGKQNVQEFPLWLSRLRT